MNKWFYNSGFYYFYRFYFIRKKSPLSYIWWSNILKRDIGGQGSYQINIASATSPDGAIWISYGAPKDNHITITIYDSQNKKIAEVKIKLNYKSMKKLSDGFDKAFVISRKNIKKESS